MTRLTVKEHIKAGTHPTCASRQQFETWAKVARNARVVHFCQDCAASYESTMKLAGRCDKHADR